ncbi:uncharacterized protein MELLADRAFT_116765 [Melampsora larici-populina 98AG31]|uniref:Sugar phosphate transporter domain-containing protein n=1 Tax=Melampsora larici-populina (strain 98AG31 / pathotype 3-4-7) TaxID=747676 RepID=F4RPN8_MELLP|nr:uncharacterized protein MELLADRAFT_116765 [Melampsora larici-populina 98AG31]EGG05698.1 hypothetical protein MELLADRAFT_116765 [Melampsora larici-populina 98AG31]
MISSSMTSTSSSNSSISTTISTISTSPSNQARTHHHSSFSSSSTLILTIFLSASLTLFNKSIYTTFNFPFPFHILALHFASISLTSRLLVKWTRPKEYASYQERVTWPFWFKNVLTVGLAYGSAILCSNLAYLLLSVSFVQMLKAFTPVVLVVATAILEQQMPPARSVVVVSIISSGVAVAAYGEIHFVLIGALCQFAGSLAEVARLIATQRLLQDLNVDPLVALSALSPICFSMAVILAPIFEGLEPISLIVPRLGLPVIFASILLALALNVVVLFLVSCTSALVLTLAGIVKDIGLIGGSVIFLGSHITSTQIGGYLVATGGLVYFRFSRPPALHSKIETPTYKEVDYEILPMESRD